MHIWPTNYAEDASFLREPGQAGAARPSVPVLAILFASAAVSGIAPLAVADRPAERRELNGGRLVLEDVPAIPRAIVEDLNRYYINALNEGHGYRRKENRDVYGQAVVLFLRHYLR